MKVNRNIVEEWMNWQKQEHLPEIISTGMFDDYRMYHLIEHDDEESQTFTVQFFTSSIEKYNQYLSEFAFRFRDKALAKWGNQFTGFRSVMKLVQ